VMLFAQPSSVMNTEIRLPPPSRKDKVRKIIAEEARRCGISVDELLEDNRRGWVLGIRQYAMWRARIETKCSLPELGVLFDCSHVTIKYAFRKVEAIAPDLRGVFGPKPMDAARGIIAEEAARGGYSVDEILSQKQTKRLRSVRQYAMWRAHKETKCSLVDLGEAFDRDHSSVLHTIRRVEAMAPDLRGVFSPCPKVRIRQKIIPRPRKVAETYQGRPCGYGHSGLRYRVNRRCIECNAIGVARRYWQRKAERENDLD